MGGKEAKERRKLKRLEEAKKLNGGNQDVRSQGNKRPNGSKSNEKIPISKKSNAFASKSKFDMNRGPRGGNGTGTSRCTTGTGTRDMNRGPRGGNGTGTSRGTGTGTRAPQKNDKIKKPKHLARKMNATADPLEMEELLTKQQELQTKKSERSARFKEKIIRAVGGKAFFDATVYDTIMEQGGCKMETIIEAVKIKEEGEAMETSGAQSSTEEGNASNMLNNDSSATQTEDKVAPVEAPSEGNDPEEEAASDDTEKEDIANVVPKKASDNDENANDGSTSSSDPDSGSKRKSNDDGSDSDNSSDDEKDDLQQNVRSRGRKRKKLKDVDAKREELNTIEQEKAKKLAEELAEKEKSKKTTRADDKRRCIGRKALTDYEVGKTYTGTVRYVKPTLGLFIDIGSHADAFCHISRASDDRIESITDDLYKKGDILEDKVRIVSVDRVKKRITASLQSEEKKIDEEKSAKEWNERLKKKRSREYKKSSGGNGNFRQNDHAPQHGGRSSVGSVTEQSTWKEDTKPHEEAPIVIDEFNMTPAELKRARKLQRRQERRQLQESEDA